MVFVTSITTTTIGLLAAESLIIITIYMLIYYVWTEEKYKEVSIIIMYIYGRGLRREEAFSLSPLIL